MKLDLQDRVQQHSVKQDILLRLVQELEELIKKQEL